MEQHKTIVFEEHTLHYRDEGRNHEQTLVLLHGYLQNLDIWSSYVLSYMRTMHVITIDLPGHGYSECFGDVHSMDLMAKAVKAVLDDAGVEQCVMVGHSMGGYVALAFADLFPHHLRGLGLLHSHALADTDKIIERRMETCDQVMSNRASYIVGFIPPLFDVSKRNELTLEIKDLQDQCLETKAESIVAAQRGRWRCLRCLCMARTIPGYLWNWRWHRRWRPGMRKYCCWIMWPTWPTLKSGTMCARGYRTL